MTRYFFRAVALCSLLSVIGVGCTTPSTPAAPLAQPTEKPTIPPEAKNVPLPTSN